MIKYYFDAQRDSMIPANFPRERRLLGWAELGRVLTSDRTCCGMLPLIVPTADIDVGL